ncbi:DUF1853 family protein [Stutzerimonas azotifigens]|uniref:DUF1853 family protein n=1 Tax=Stutzerimonas azotifigens TaxID=291995 RepID=UPI0004113EE2|nr:DUF1853 family protein [Stutzerimonas azotifigens]
MTLEFAELLHRLRHPRVRDLAWVLLAPPLLLATPAPQRHPLQESRWYRQPGLLADWLLHQELDPAALENWLARASNRRLGLYYERLWQFALSRAPDVELLAANLPIRLGGQTLGELDLVLRDPAGVQHCELAIKFYLRRAGADPLRHDSWVGPGGRDRLDLKLARLQQHQLGLSATAEGLATLRELTEHDLAASLWLGGYLFAPWPGDTGAPAGANPTHLRGRWVPRRDWGTVIAAMDGPWQPLPRAAWLAPARLAPSQAWDRRQLDEWLASLPETFQPQLLAGLAPGPDNHWLERERLFLVPDGWPDLAPDLL